MTGRTGGSASPSETGSASTEPSAGSTRALVAPGSLGSPS